MELDLHKFSSFVPMASTTGDFEEMPLLAGQGVGLIESIPTVAEAISQIVTDATKMVTGAFGAGQLAGRSGTVSGGPLGGTVGVRDDAESVESVLADATTALWRPTATCGTAGAVFEAAYIEGERTAAGLVMATAALGLCGQWMPEHRGQVAASLLDARLAARAVVHRSADHPRAAAADQGRQRG